MSHNCYGITFSLPANVDVAKCFHSKKVENVSLREVIANLKANKYSPPLSEIKITNHNTGETYTMAEIDKMLNN